MCSHKMMSHRQCRTFLRLKDPWKEFDKLSGFFIEIDVERDDEGQQSSASWDWAL